jgi:Mn2+/Fe2+ NRAMP family transporter
VRPSLGKRPAGAATALRPFSCAVRLCWLGILADPDPWETLRGTFVPYVELSKKFLSVLVALIGTTLSAYLYTWQSNVEVEEKIAEGKTRLADRQGASDDDLRRSRRDIVIGMAFSNVIMYFIILSTGSRQGQYARLQYTELGHGPCHLCSQYRAHRQLVHVSSSVR